MPLHVYTVDGDEEVTLAEAWLTRPDLERLVKLGLMPLLPVKGQNAMQLLRFLSLTQPPKGQQSAELLGAGDRRGWSSCRAAVGLRS